ncbi:hypothetical protein JTE90_027566 [Oedothorax gibbosus]|uniref:Gem-associated protein 7 n=1 Tax=Oedothorax gibbosus TaxID=931172 RepID=A0AAV6VLQ7_9ARAC|nr:hypothetical protein JTE90_027566 [Oedothorax gibbosus]
MEAQINAESQEKFAKLRNDYLLAISALKGRNVQVDMHNNITISAKFQVIHPNGKRVFVSDAVIPSGEIQNNVLLRSSDIISMIFEEDTSE